MCATSLVGDVSREARCAQVFFLRHAKLPSKFTTPRDHPSQSTFTITTSSATTLVFGRLSLLSYDRANIFTLSSSHFRAYRSPSHTLAHHDHRNSHGESPTTTRALQLKRLHRRDTMFVQQARSAEMGSRIGELTARTQPVDELALLPGPL